MITSSLTKTLTFAGSVHASGRGTEESVAQMQDEWMLLPEDRLAAAAQQGPHAQVEAMRRLRVAIEQASAKNEIYLRRMFWLNITLAIMTFFLAIAVVPAVVQAVVIVRGWFG